MPELPEVETIVRDLRPRVQGRVLTQPRLSHSDVLHLTTRAGLLRGLAGRTVREISRRAKNAVFLLDSGKRLIVQPGMTGAFLIHDAPLSDADKRYAVLTASLGNGSTLVYRDVRRLGTILLLDEKRWQVYSGRIGPEPLDPDFDAGTFERILAGSRQAIKKVIMDQHKLAGVGNIYANEALFRARIDPSLPSNRVSPRQASQLHRAIRKILSQAIASQGTTFRDYRTGTGERGSFQLRLYVYGREGKPCRRCGSILAMTHLIDARSTTFCWRCQGITQ